MIRRTAFIAALVMLSLALGAVPGRTTASNQAGVVVRFGDAEVRRICVVFDEAEISGENLLRRTGLTLTVEQSSYGTAICRIDRDGCNYPNEPCFCRSPVFWGYWTRDSNSSKWTFSQEGSAARKIHNGSVDAWVWGRDGKPEPEDATINDVCAEPATPAPGDSSLQAENPPARERRSPNPAARNIQPSGVIAVAPSPLVTSPMSTAHPSGEQASADPLLAVRLPLDSKEQDEASPRRIVIGLVALGLLAGLGAFFLRR